jgi:hypothetical protein
MGKQILFVSPPIADPQILLLIPQSQIREFPCCPSPKIANPQICKVKNSISDPDPHSFAFQYLFLVSKLSQKPKVILKFEGELFKLIFVRRKIMYLRKF